MMNKQSMNELWQHVASIAMVDATAYDDSDNYFYRLRRGDDTSGITVLSWDGGSEWMVARYENEEAWECGDYSDATETTRSNAAYDFNH
jgi:hypothetical protein